MQAHRAAAVKASLQAAEARSPRMHPPDPASMIFCLSLNEAEAHEPRREGNVVVKADVAPKLQ
jgi:hypothetical protein